MAAAPLPRTSRLLLAWVLTAAATLSLKAGDAIEPIVFVSRQIPRGGSIYWDIPNEMPGVGPRSRFRVAAPGRLVVRESGGALHTLIDGAAPAALSQWLVDVNAPDVSYDGKRLVFAGLPKGHYSTEPVSNPGGWRIYTMAVNGTDLRAVTRSDQNLDLAQFGQAAGALEPYDDTDPVWLPDGRIVFSSTRWPSFAQYSGVRTTNLYVVNPGGAGLHRITSERNGADRPLVDPVTGKIVYSRWWRNHRFASDDLSTIPDGAGGYTQKDGLTTRRDTHVGGSTLFRNAWQLTSINPDGTELTMWAGAFRNEAGNHAYGGAFTSTGEFLANFFPMYNMTEASGFGGIRKYHRGPGIASPVLGVTALTFDYVHPSNPTSYGIFKGSVYTAEPDVLSDGRIVLSAARDVQQDYGLYITDPDGKTLTKLYDNAGTSELRPRVIRPRRLPPVLPDSVRAVAALLPPPAAGPYDNAGTFLFDALNVYANAPVDVPITTAPPVGSAARIRFFLDHQRTSPGSFPSLDWPVLLDEVPVAPEGVVRHRAPADVPLFEQLRDAAMRVPQTTAAAQPTGAAHVTGMNFGRPGSVVRCVGCHAGHSMIPVPASDEAALWTNLAPGAAITVSSTRDAAHNVGLIDRLAKYGETSRYWSSKPGAFLGQQWVQLTFPVRIAVRRVLLYNPRSGDDAKCSVQVRRSTVRLFADAEATLEVGRADVGALSADGTSTDFKDVPVRAVRIEIQDAIGTFFGAHVASLAEVEVIAKGLEAEPAGASASTHR